MPTTPESYLDADDPNPVIGLDAGGNKIDPMGRAIDNFFRGLIPGSLPQAPEQVQIGTTNAATPALGIQAGTLEEDIDQEAGGVGNVWDNIAPALEGGGDPFTEDDNISPLAGITPPRKPMPPQAAQTPQAPPPTVGSEVFDDDPTTPHEWRLGGREQQRDLRRADPDYWGLGGPGDDSIVGDIMDFFRPDPITEIYDDDFTSGTAARAARREQEKAIAADNQGVTSPPVAAPPAVNPNPRARIAQGSARPPQLQAPTVPSGAALSSRAPRGAGQTQPQAAPSPPVEAQVTNPNPRARIAQGSATPEAVTSTRTQMPIRGRRPPPAPAPVSTEAEFMDTVAPQVPTRGTAPRVSPMPGGRDVRPPVQQQGPETAQQNALLNWLMSVIAGGKQRVTEYDTERNMTNIGP